MVSDSLWDSMRFRYKLTRAGNVRLAVFRDVDGDRALGAEDDTVCVFRSSLQDSAGVVSPFDEGRWGEPWAWVAENFGYTLKPGAAHGDTARVINEVVWNGEIDTLYVQRGPLPDEPWSSYPRRGTDCDSNYIAGEGVYLARLEVDEFADAGSGADDSGKGQPVRGQEGLHVLRHVGRSDPVFSAGHEEPNTMESSAAENTAGLA